MHEGRFLVLSLSLVLSACVSPVALEKAVLAYDRTLSLVRSQVLLLNIARARQGLPLNASEVTALTAAFEFSAQASAGATIGPIGGVADTTGNLSLGLTTRAVEAPTLSIIPLQGEAFTRRLLSRRMSDPALCHPARPSGPTGTSRRSRRSRTCTTSRPSTLAWRRRNGSSTSGASVDPRSAAHALTGVPK